LLYKFKIASTTRIAKLLELLDYNVLNNRGIRHLAVAFSKNKQKIYSKYEGSYFI